MKDYSKTTATYGAISAIVNNGIHDLKEIKDCLQNAILIVSKEIETETGKPATETENSKQFIYRVEEVVFEDGEIVMRRTNSIYRNFADAKQWLEHWAIDINKGRYTKPNGERESALYDRNNQTILVNIEKDVLY